MNRFTQLQTWYASHCNTEWEHTYGVKIDTLDNPGWTVTIDLVGTELDNVPFTPKVEQRSETDWLHCNVNDRAFKGAGDPDKLEIILGIFLDWASQHTRPVG
jgi:hypothetical protein